MTALGDCFFYYNEAWVKLSKEYSPPAWNIWKYLCLLIHILTACSFFRFVHWSIRIMMLERLQENLECTVSNKLWTHRSVRFFFSSSATHGICVADGLMLFRNISVKHNEIVRKTMIGWRDFLILNNEHIYMSIDIICTRDNSYSNKTFFRFSKTTKLAPRLGFALAEREK